MTPEATIGKGSLASWETHNMDTYGDAHLQELRFSLLLGCSVCGRRLIDPDTDYARGNIQIDVLEHGFVTTCEHCSHCHYPWSQRE